MTCCFKPIEVLVRNSTIKLATLRNGQLKDVSGIAPCPFALFCRWFMDSKLDVKIMERNGTLQMNSLQNHAFYNCQYPQLCGTIRKYRFPHAAIPHRQVVVEETH